jgi:hypothetical protein
LFGDFSEEELKRGIDKLVEARVNALVEPLRRAHEENISRAHYAAIYTAHPDADDIVKGQELKEWIGKQPSFVRESCARILEAGSADQVIELFSSFKQATAKPEPKPETKPDPAIEQVKAEAEKAIQKAAAKPPASLSDIPGGKPPSADGFESIANMNPADMAEALAALPPEQIEKFLQRHL